MEMNKEGFKNFEIFYRKIKGCRVQCSLDELNEIIRWQPNKLQKIIDMKFMQGVSDCDIALSYGYNISRVNNLCMEFVNRVEKEILCKYAGYKECNFVFDTIACEKISDAYERNCGEKLEYTVEGMNKVIGGLSEKMREILTLRFIKDLTYSEIAYKTTYSITHISDICNKCFRMFNWPGIKIQLLGGECQVISDDASIDDLGLSVRARRILMFNGISTIGRLRCCSRSDLLKVDHIGSRFVKDIIEKLNAYGVLFDFQVEENKLSKLGTSIDRLNLRRPLLNTLNINGIYTVEQLRECNYNRLLDMNGIGVKSISDIKSALKQFGLEENLPDTINVKATVPRDKVKNGMVTVTFEFKDSSGKYEVFSIT